MAFYNDLNNLGKLYDAKSRFRLLLTITKDDAKARILKLMAKGQVIGFKTFNEAVEAQNAFHADADYLLDSNSSKEDFASYGLSCIIDERDGCVHCTKHFGRASHKPE